MAYDILIRNGHVIDPQNGVDEVRTIAISGDRFAEYDAHGAAGEEIDAAGCYVFPGLIDHHAHLFYGGSEFAIKPEFCVPFGVTAAVDAGTAGSANFDVFYQSTIAPGPMRLFAYLSGNPGGLYGRQWHTHYNAAHLEKGQPGYRNIKAAFEKYPNRLLGLKLMLSTANVGDRGLAILDAALRLAEEIGCRVCVHTTDMSVTAADVASRLRKGDIYCHCFTCTDGKSILGADHTVLPEVLEAKRRGVLFDAANGMLHYDHEVASAAVAQGFLPDIISTDAVSYSLNMGRRVRNLPFLMSKYLCMGLSLPQVVGMTTSVPARAMGKEKTLGTLSPGALADAAIFRLCKTPVLFEDAAGRRWRGESLLVPQMTILNGRVAYCQTNFPENI